MGGRIARCALAALAVAGCAPRAPAPLLIGPGTAALACSNPQTGYRWTIRLDPRVGQADGWSARFGDHEIIWRDEADGGRYELDRRTGVLAITRASSTGGYVSLDRCRPAQSAAG